MESKVNRELNVLDCSFWHDDQNCTAITTHSLATHNTIKRFFIGFFLSSHQPMVSKHKQKTTYCHWIHTHKFFFSLPLNIDFFLGSMNFKYLSLLHYLQNYWLIRFSTSNLIAKTIVNMIVRITPFTLTNSNDFDWLSFKKFIQNASWFKCTTDDYEKKRKKLKSLKEDNKDSLESSGIS